MSVTDIVDNHLRVLEPRWTNFLLNCPPNREGLMDAAIVTRLGEVDGRGRRTRRGRSCRRRDADRVPVHARERDDDQRQRRTRRGDRRHQRLHRYTIWRSSGTLPQSLTLDLGTTKPDVWLLADVPEYVTNAAVIAGYDHARSGILVSTDGDDVHRRRRQGRGPPTAKMKLAMFGPVAARYVRLEARAASGGTRAVATEITVGARR